MVEVLHELRFETLALSSMNLCSVLMSFRVYIRILHTSDKVDCDMDLKLDDDLIEILVLQSNVTVLKSQSESQSLEFRKSTQAPLQLITGIP